MQIHHILPLLPHFKGGRCYISEANWNILISKTAYLGMHVNFYNQIFERELLHFNVPNLDIYTFIILKYMEDSVNPMNQCSKYT